eukprot:TRINITY_DN5138_c0_g1_i3.p3 TRINITY_DN5138_c0_g1~~TRINITY_DN5138_c0_g1_i3.p3  ORF type:complete len:310 (+),score=77.52 TRINITY_DN5138_c0_g1_i3:3879-4808(+)
MYLKNIISGTVTSSSSVLIIDKYELSGESLKLHFLDEWQSSTKIKHIFVLTMDHDEKYYFRRENVSNLFLFDGYTDPLGWKGNQDTDSAQRKVCSLRDLDGLYREVVGVVSDVDAKSCVFLVDSVSSLLLRHDAASVYKFLYKIVNKLKLGSVVMSLKSDLLKEATIKSIKMIPKSIIEIVKIPPNIVTPVTNSVVLIQKRKLGKISFSKIHYIKKGDELEFIEDKYIEYMADEESEEVIVLDKNQNQQQDDFKDLSFNLSLTEEEKETRAKVELPFHQQQKSSPVIYLEESDDAFDDFDSDPDDDLEF